MSSINLAGLHDGSREMGVFPLEYAHVSKQAIYQARERHCGEG